MAENSRIEWTDHTFNPWIGCTKVHAGCTHCYAETLMDSRYGKVAWGANGTRQRTTEANWRKPLQWDRAAKAAGRPALVFCASLADVFEDWQGVMTNAAGGVVGTMPEARSDLFAMIDRTPNLIWLMLTKRPENIRQMLPGVDVNTQQQADDRNERGELFRRNVWFGTSPCNQETADSAVPDLIKAREFCGGLFLSCEPLLGPLRLDQVQYDGTVEIDTLMGKCGVHRPLRGRCGSVDWVIVGGESGQGFRPMQPEWAASIRDQCLVADVPVFIKQMAGKAEIPPHLMTRQFPEAFQRSEVASVL